MKRHDLIRHRVNDAVLVRWRRNYLLHLVKEIRDDQFLIGNNVGKINGWVSADAIVGKVVAVGDVLEAPRDIGVIEEIGPCSFGKRATSWRS